MQLPNKVSHEKTELKINMRLPVANEVVVKGVASSRIAQRQSASLLCLQCVVNSKRFILGDPGLCVDFKLGHE